ncbi:MAG: AAA family ATPase [Lachnospiraceae bacterium]|nr:AAA family ATPase [Lachnospiraceae bacterium]
MAYMKSIQIDGYRGIKKLKINELRQINLVVGDNNCGKTSVLEALQLLRTSGSLANVYKVARQRDNLSIKGMSSLYDSFICMFPRSDSDNLEINIGGTCNDKKISFKLSGKKDRILLDANELQQSPYAINELPKGEVEAEAFDGTIRLKYDKHETQKEIRLHQFTSLTGTSSYEKDLFNIIYLSPYEHLQGNIVSDIVRNEGYKRVCIRALQLFDPDIEDMMIFRSSFGNQSVEYLRHKKLGDMPVSTYGDGIKKVLALSSAIAKSTNGILLIDEIETAIHKKYYDDIFRFIVKACCHFGVQAFITTHSLEAIDGLLATQDYETNKAKDDICVCTIRREENASLSRVLPGREVYENRETFGFEVRL